MQKRKKIIAVVCVAAVSILLVCFGAAWYVWQQPQTQVALLMKDGMSEEGLLQKALSMREDKGCLAQSSGKLHMQIPLLGTVELEFEAQLDEEGMRFRLADQPETVYLYDYTDEEKQGIAAKILGRQVTEKIDNLLCLIAGGTKADEGEGRQHTGNKKELRRVAKEFFTDVEVLQAQKGRFYVDGAVRELNGYTIVLSKEQCQKLLEYVMNLSNLAEKEMAGQPGFDDMLGGDTLQVSFYGKDRHLKAVQFAGGEGMCFSLQETEEGFVQMTFETGLLGDTSLDMEVCYLPKEYADIYNDVTLDIGSFSLPQLPGLFGLW